MADTRILSIDPAHPDPAIIAEAGAALREGRLVAFPTETVYGLGAHALDAAAVRRIFEAKGRPAADPLIVHITRRDQLEPLVSRVPPALSALERFWPGPLTVVMPKSARVPLEVTAGLDSVAVRIPAHPVARALIEAAGVPVAAPSANLFTRPSPTRAGHVYQDLAGRIDLIVDGGPTQHGLESTVVSLLGDHPRLLRPGAITVERLREALADLEVPEPVLVSGETTGLLSPGTHLKHYSPRARMRVLVGEPARLRTALREEVQAWLARGVRVGVMLTGEALSTVEGLDVERAALGGAGDLEAAGARLFAALRELDEAGVEVIVTTGFPPEGLGRALQDRLLRAAEGQVIPV